MAVLPVEVAVDDAVVATVIKGVPPTKVTWNSLLKSAAGTPPTAVVTPLNVTQSPSVRPDVIFNI